MENIQVTREYLENHICDLVKGLSNEALAELYNKDFGTSKLRYIDNDLFEVGEPEISHDKWRFGG